MRRAATVQVAGEEFNESAADGWRAGACKHAGTQACAEVDLFFLSTLSDFIMTYKPFLNLKKISKLNFKSLHVFTNLEYLSS